MSSKKLTKLEIQCLIPTAYDIFKKTMPPIDTPFPRWYIADGRNFRKVREQALSDVACAYKETPADESIMEYIHGEKGGAILIRQNLLPNDSSGTNINNEQNFCWYFWHELGHWYAINSEKDNLHRYNDPDLLDNISLADRNNGVDRIDGTDGIDGTDTTALQLKQDGYWFWQEFIAEAISKHVSGKYDAEVIYTNKPDHIDWKPTVWGPIAQYLMNLLDAAFSPFISTVDDYALAHYFANLFKRDVVVLYTKAAATGELKVYASIGDEGCKCDDERRFDEHKGDVGRCTDAKDNIVYPDEPIDATCISDIDPEEFQPATWELYRLLKEQMQKERFWEIDEDYLLELGKCIKELQDVKVRLIAAMDSDMDS